MSSMKRKVDSRLEDGDNRPPLKKEKKELIKKIKGAETPVPKNSSISAEKTIGIKNSKEGRISHKKLNSAQGNNLVGSTLIPEKGIDSNWMKLKATLDRKHPSKSSNFVKGKVHSKPHEREKVQNNKKEEPNAENLLPMNNRQGLTKVIGMDCEMVGTGVQKNRSLLARICLINMHGNVIYDKFVIPAEEVTDYRTKITGIRAKDLKIENGAVDLFTVQKEVGDLLKGKIIVGHALHNDLKVLMISHPRRLLRDTQNYKLIYNGKKSPSLQFLAQQELGVKIQTKEHSPVEDARAALYIYLRHKINWEKSLQKRTP